MNPELSRQLAACRIDDFRREVGQREAAQRAGAERPARTAARPQLRSRIGFALVEAGLRLLAEPSVTARPGLD